MSACVFRHSLSPENGFIAVQGFDDWVLVVGEVNAHDVDDVVREVDPDRPSARTAARPRHTHHPLSSGPMI